MSEPYAPGGVAAAAGDLLFPLFNAALNEGSNERPEGQLSEIQEASGVLKGEGDGGEDERKEDGDEGQPGDA